jgi:hypothetical protein
MQVLNTLLSAPNLTKDLVASSDVSNALKTGAVGFASLFGTEMVYRMMKRKIDPCVEIKFPTEAIQYDAGIREAFVKLQHYAELSPYLFKTALNNIDSLLFLERALMLKEIHPKPLRDKQLAFANISVCASRLQCFQQLIKHHLGAHHAFVANIYVKQIYERARVHVLNVFHLCDAVNTSQLLAEAPSAIADLKRDGGYE